MTIDLMRVCTETPTWYLIYIKIWYIKEFDLYLTWYLKCIERYTKCFSPFSKLYGCPYFIPCFQFIFIPWWLSLKKKKQISRLVNTLKNMSLMKRAGKWNGHTRPNKCCLFEPLKQLMLYKCSIIIYNNKSN